MKNSKKLILVMVSIICIVILLVGSIAYYRIVVNGSIKGSTGNAVFVLRDSDNSVWDNKVIDLGKINPGDSGEFTVTLDASGSTVDMYATLEIERTNLPTNLKFYTTSDHKSELHKYYSFLETTNQTETLTIYWYWNPYISDEEDSKFINVSNLEANVRVSAVQISEYAMMKNGNGVTSDSRLYFWKDTYRPYIRTITFGNDLNNLPSSCTEENLCWDVSESNSKKKVYGYLIDSGLNVQVDVDENNNPIYQALYNLYIVSEAPIFAPSDCSLFFAGFNSLVTINYNDNFNTSKVTNMSYMFLPITGSKSGAEWNNVIILTSGIKNVKPSFLNNKRNNVKTELLSAPSNSDMITLGYYYSSLTELNLSSFNTKNVVNMKYMFAENNTLISLNLSNFNTINVENLEGLFYECIGISELNLKSFNTSKTMNMQMMFYGCSSLTNLGISSFDTSKVTDISSMFYDCSSLTSLDLGNFNTTNVTNMRMMFAGCESLTNIDLSSFNTQNVTDMGSMFDGCSSLISLDLSNFNTSSVTYMDGMFYDCTKIQLKITVMNPNMTSYDSILGGEVLNDTNAYVILGYTTDTQSIATAMKNTCNNSSKITLKQIS